MPSKQTTSDLLSEKATLQKRLADINNELGETQLQPSNTLLSKSGYLFKWLDREIGWAGTKWDLRFVRLERGRLCYYKSHEDAAPVYVLSLRRCAVRDDGYKPNRQFQKNNSNNDIKTPNAFFHVFSIYQRPVGLKDTKQHAQQDDEDEISPLLRFSTKNYAEKQQWVELISEACAYCDSDHYLQNGFNDDYFSPLAMGNRTENMKTEKGTIPRMYFAPAPMVKLTRVSSIAHIKTSANKNACRSNMTRQSDYPASKPMHLEAKPSYLSDEAPIQNYRGVLNLAMIILLISNFRLLLVTFQEYNIVLAQTFSMPEEGFSLSTEIVVDYPFLFGFTLLIVIVNLAFGIEYFLSHGTLGERFGIVLHVVNVNLALFGTMVIVWYLIESPILGGILLNSGVVTWMKLISYIHANADYRSHPNRASPKVQHFDDQNGDVSYPKNITFCNIYYFMLAPTLTYQINFPQVPQRRWFRITTLLVRFVSAIAVILFLLFQVIAPHLDAMIKDFENRTTQSYQVFSIDIIAEYLLKLTMASTYCWLLFFYLFFHLYLNILAEILRFGDRVFYKDWWNSSNVSSYWRLWNLPVHYWLIRHLYFPSIRLGLKKTGATFVVFLFSAIMHEVVFSIPFHMIRPWGFLGMMAQIPLIVVTKYFDKIKPGSSIGNIIFWFSFCIVGQPMAILMYTIDYWEKTTELPSVPTKRNLFSALFRKHDEL